MDKWLWAARFFKTRSLASKACELGRIQLGGHEVKASREVGVGDRLKVRNEGGEFVVDVLGLSEIRGPAVAAQLYLETEESRTSRIRLAEERKAIFAAEPMPETKPSKRDRRILNRFRGR
jgi:ribosome-associated heat shock protein Hsp15